MRKDGYENKVSARHGGQWQLNKKELVQLNKDYARRLHEIVDKAINNLPQGQRRDCLREIEKCRISKQY